MKIIIMKTLAAVIIAGVMLFTSCQGPPGPTGYTGTVGATGQQGAPGTNGTNGVSGVTYTALPAATTWTWSPTYYYTEATYTISPTILTQAVVDSGAVMLYEQTGTLWRAMPYMISATALVTENVRYDYTFGSILIIESYSNDSMITGSIGNLKLVCISAGARLANPNLDLNNFEAVKNAFHIK
ncbi:MAG: collagen-like triple helix repeat-containing protein [Bacteroidia bacterium]